MNDSDGISLPYICEKYAKKKNEKSDNANKRLAMMSSNDNPNTVRSRQSKVLEVGEGHVQSVGFGKSWKIMVRKCCKRKWSFRFYDVGFCSFLLVRLLYRICARIGGIGWAVCFYAFSSFLLF